MRSAGACIASNHEMCRKRALRGTASHIKETGIQDKGVWHMMSNARRACSFGPAVEGIPAYTLVQILSTRVNFELFLNRSANCNLDIQVICWLWALGPHHGCAHSNVILLRRYMQLAAGINYCSILSSHVIAKIPIFRRCVLTQSAGMQRCWFVQNVICRQHAIFFLNFLIYFWNIDKINLWEHQGPCQ